MNQPTLNTTFNGNANIAFNTHPETATTISTMHERTRRLYEAAEQLCDVTGQTNVAKALNISAQTLNNWEARGVSFKGMVLAEKLIGCSAAWLRTGEGPMVAGTVEVAVEGETERRMLDDFAWLLEEDKARIAEEVRRLADVGRTYQKRFGSKTADDAHVAAAIPPVTTTTKVRS